MTELTDEAVKALPNEIQVWRNRDTLDHIGTWATTRYPPEAMTYVPKAELDRLRAESDAFRMCVNCGLIVPASHDRAQPGPGCAAPDACTFDLTPREACDHWRAKAHKYQADAQAAVALVVEKAVAHFDTLAATALKEHGATYNIRSQDHWLAVNSKAEWAAREIRALAPADGLAAVEALRGEARESAMQALASMGQAQEAYEAQLKAEAELAAAQQREAEWHDGSRPLPFDRDTVGRMVREAWVRWAETQPSPKPSWLVPYDELNEADKEADRQIGEAVARWTLAFDAARAALSNNGRGA